MQTINQSQTEWVKILAKGMVTIPKSFREAVGIKPGEVAKIKKVGNRLIIESRDTADFELYSDQELQTMIKEDKLPVKLAAKATDIWSDLL